MRRCQSKKKKQQLSGEDDKSILYNDLDTESSDIDKEYEINKQVFQKLDSLIRRDELYLSADLSREDLVRMAHMNNTRFAKMIKKIRVLI